MSRYARQEVYPFIGSEGQTKLANAHVIIVGVGALGTQSASLLARAGVGSITLIDRDSITEDNLQRQVLFTENDIGKPKASTAKKHLEAINSTITVTAYDDDLTNETIEKYIPYTTTVIVDGTDNMETRFLVNDYALQQSIPWVYGAGIQGKGSIMTVLPKKQPCFACVFADHLASETCQTAGVFNVTTALVGSYQAAEAMKIILNKPPIEGLLWLNSEKSTVETLAVQKNPTCMACQGQYMFLHADNPSGILKFCSTGNYQVPINETELSDLKERLNKIETVEDMGGCLKVKNMLIFPSRCLVHADSESEAKKIVAKYIGS